MLDDDKSGRQKIYRYMNFTKFCDLIFKQKLYFSRADCQNDNAEGQISKVDQLYRKYMHPESKDNELTLEDFQKMQKMFLINCWCKDSIESFAMWEIYAANRDGIAIESTIDNLNESFIYNPEYKKHEFNMKDINIEMILLDCARKRDVSYIDYKREPVSSPCKEWHYERFFIRGTHLTMKKNTGF